MTTIGTQFFSFVMRELAANQLVVYMKPEPGTPYQCLELRNPDQVVLMKVDVTYGLGPPEYCSYEVETFPEIQSYFNDAFVKALSADLGVRFLHSGVTSARSKHEPLVCNVCDECQIVPRSKGAPSQKAKCKMTPRCEGFLRRVEPCVFQLVLPKKKRTTKRGVVVTPIEEVA